MMYRLADESTGRSHSVGVDEAEARQSRPAGRQDGERSELGAAETLLGLPPLDTSEEPANAQRDETPSDKPSRDEAVGVSSNATPTQQGFVEPSRKVEGTRLRSALRGLRELLQILEMRESGPYYSDPYFRILDLREENADLRERLSEVRGNYAALRGLMARAPDDEYAAAIAKLYCAPDETREFALRALEWEAEKRR